MADPGDNDNIVKIVGAFLGGGIINTGILAFLFMQQQRMKEAIATLDRRLSNISVHLAYIRKELRYSTGREAEEGDDNETFTP